ncbi:hypothetical protein H6P81_018592 [Aristolochia fimbriata]|uniref:Integrase catalytic domain-containing protein n=1 Tax=Aristolochia fimbriata TaxID=158543 RepID=A0AAV7E2D5_ARIFI|nr:hypothetical protein H6P81_018592 [Aristolochia fimbriata]
MDWDTVGPVHLSNQLIFNLVINRLEDSFLHVISVGSMVISDLIATSYKEFEEDMKTLKELSLVSKIWSGHMTGNVESLTNLQKENGGQVTFGDGGKGSVIGRGDLNVQGLPKLRDVLLVDGLKANLISISQLCDQNLYVNFTKCSCKVLDEENISVLEGKRTCDNCYKIILSHQCQYTRENTAQLWHKRLGHIHSRGLQKLINYGAVRGLPTLTGAVETMCKGCMEGKQHRTPHSALKIITTKQPLKLLHIDLMGPVQTESIAGKKYVMLLMTEKGVTIGRIVRIRSDHGKEFENQDFANFCESKGILHEFSAPKTPQQNGIVERKNRTLQEMARTMINAKELPHKLWVEAVNTACYVRNRVHLRYLTHKTPYELWKGRKPKVHYFREFDSRCHVLRDREQLRKFDSRSTEGIFVGYSRNSHSYRVFLKNANTVIETVNVEVADQTEDLQMSDDEQEHVPRIQKEGTYTPEGAPEDTGVSSTEVQESVVVTEKTPSIREQNNHPTDAIIGDIHEGMKTRGKKKNYGDMVKFVCYTSLVEPRKVEEALKDEFWIRATQEELEQFKRNEVWTLVPRPTNINVIGTKWVFKNKTDEEGNIIRNKARLVAQGYTQVEGIDVDETFAPVA